MPRGAKAFIFTRDFGFIRAGRKLKQAVDGDYFLSAKDEEVIDGTLPWVGSVRLRKSYVESLPPDLLKPTKY